MQAEVAVHEGPRLALGVAHVNSRAEHHGARTGEGIKIGPQGIPLDTETVRFFAGMAASTSAKSLRDGYQLDAMPRLLRAPKKRLDCFL